MSNPYQHDWNRRKRKERDANDRRIKAYTKRKKLEAEAKARRKRRKIIALESLSDDELELAIVLYQLHRDNMWELTGSGLLGGVDLDVLRNEIDNNNYEEFEVLLFEDLGANVDILVPYVLKVFNEIEDDARDYLIRLIEDAEANPNVVDEEGETAFTRAVMIGNTEYIYILNMYGELDVNIRNENGHTPLTLAVYRGDIDMVLFIMRNFNLEDHADGPPVIMAAKEGNDVLVMNIMSNFGLEEDED